MLTGMREVTPTGLDYSRGKSGKTPVQYCTAMETGAQREVGSGRTGPVCTFP